MSLKAKMLTFCLVVGILPLSVIGVYSVTVASRSLKAQAFGQLESVRDVKRDYLQYMVGRWLKEVRIYAAVKEVYNAVGMLRDQLMETKAGERAKVDVPEYEDLYKYVIAAFEPFAANLGFADVLLIDDYGRVLLTHARGRDNGEDLVHGQLLKDSNLRQAWERAMKGETAFVDFARYPALGGEPAAFVAAPVLDHNSKVAGVAALRISLDELNGLMLLRSGMGETGETFLVGEDGTMRSDSFRDSSLRSVKASMADPGRGSVRTDSARLGIEGRTGIHESVNYQGLPVLSAYAPFEAGGVRWVLLAEIEQAEAFAPSMGLMRAAQLMGVAVCLLVVAVTVIFLRRELLAPLAALQSFAERIVAGELEAVCEGRFKGELARVRTSIMGMVTNLKDKLQEVKRNADIAREKTAEAETALAEAEEARTRAVRARQEGVLEAVRTLESVARRIDVSVGTLSEQARSVVRDAGTQKSRASETTTAMEQMNQTILDISRNAGRAANETDTARDNAVRGAEVVNAAVAAILEVSSRTEALKEQVASLGNRAESIGAIIDVISDIADQTEVVPKSRTGV